MSDRKRDMQALFSELSQSNKDVMLLIAKGMMAAQEATKHLYTQPKTTVSGQ
ncbi:MAG: hypothetical protein HFG75_07740 [Hungatella sp.]|nr:hypothetical protein [Hungatella sp.]